MPATLEQETTRAFCPDLEVRAIDEEQRRATFVIATENPVLTVFGREVLRISGVDLARFKKNPVVLDTHNRWEAGAVVGRAVSVKKERRQLVAEVEFAETERAEVIWELVRTDFIRATSVGFMADRGSVLVIDEGESNGSGESRVEGPARIVKKWELLELSIVPVPADMDSLKRGFFEGDAGLVPGLVEVIVGLMKRDKEPTVMADKKDEKDKNGTGENTLPPTGGDAAVPAVRSADAGATHGLPPMEGQVFTDAERAGRDLDTLNRSIRSIAPEGLEHIADRCILDGLSLDESRAELLKEHSKRTQSVGTPEPVIEGADGDSKGDETEGETRVKDLDDGSFARAITG